MPGTIHKNDIGTELVCEFKDDDEVLDISAATTIQGKFKKPTGEVIVKTLDLVTDGSDGLAKYVTVSNDLDVVGRWKLQGLVVIPTPSPSRQFNSTMAEFVVHDNVN